MAYKVGGGGTSGRGSKTGGGGKKSQGPRQPLSMKRGGPSRQGTGGGNRPDAGRGGGFARQGASDRSRPDARKGGQPSGQTRERSRRSFEPPEFSTQRPAAPKPGGGRTSGTPRQEGRFGSRPEARPGPGRREQTGGTFESRGGQRPQRRPSLERPAERRFEREPRKEITSQKPVMPVQAEEPEDRVWGINPVLELLRSGARPVDAIWVDSEKGGKQFGEIITLARKKGIAVKFIPKEGLDGMSGAQRHQGVIAAVSPKEYADPYAVAEAALKSKKAPLLIILDGIEDPHNLGAIIRTAESSGADGIVLPEHRAAHLTTTVAKASAGALEYMPVAKVTSLAGYLDFLKEKGFWIAGLAGESGKEYGSFDMTVPLAVVLGSEGEGIRSLIKKKCDVLLSLPMLGKVSSLNVSVAAGVVLYEAVRQRKNSAINKN